MTIDRAQSEQIGVRVLSPLTPRARDESMTNSPRKVPGLAAPSARAATLVNWWPIRTAFQGVVFKLFAKGVCVLEAPTVGCGLGSECQSDDGEESVESDFASRVRGIVVSRPAELKPSGGNALLAFFDQRPNLCLPSFLPSARWDGLC